MKQNNDIGPYFDCAGLSFWKRVERYGSRTTQHDMAKHNTTQQQIKSQQNMRKYFLKFKKNSKEKTHAAKCVYKKDVLH